MTTVLIAGGSGLIGSALADLLRDRGDRAITLTRTPGGSPDERGWDPASGHLPIDVLEGIDAVVNLAGASIGDKRWTRSRRIELVTSRTGPTTLLARAIAAHNGANPGQPVRTLVQGSAIGFYGDRPGEDLDESSSPGTGFIPGLVQQWEAAAEPARAAGVPVAYARTGLVLSRRGGALARMLPLIKAGLGGPLGSGRQVWSWITIEDEARALAHLIDCPHDGPVNLTAPNPVMNKDLTRAIGRAVHRPVWLPVPGFALRVALGGFASEILASQTVRPTQLVTGGFTYTHPLVDDAASWIASTRG